MNKILYMPIDLPAYDTPLELIENFTPKAPEGRNVAYEFEYQKLTTTPGEYGISEWLNYGKFEKWLESLLPIKQIVNVRINHYTKDGGMHRDFVYPKDNKELWNHCNKLEPCGYRMVIQGDRNFKLDIEKSNGEIVYPTFPEETNWYAISGTETLHGGMKEDPDRYILFTNFWVDEPAHSDLIKRSMEKYKEYIIYDV